MARIKEAVNAGEALTVQLLNYKKDGTPFWNQLQLQPVKDASGVVTTYVGAQLDISTSVASGPGRGGAGGAAGGAGGGPATAASDIGILPVSERETDPLTSIGSLLSCEAEGLVRVLLFLCTVGAGCITCGRHVRSSAELACSVC